MTVKNALYKKIKGNERGSLNCELIKVLDTRIYKTREVFSECKKQKYTYTEYEYILLGYDQGFENQDIFTLTEDEFSKDVLYVIV